MSEAMQYDKRYMEQAVKLAGHGRKMEPII